MGYVDDLMLGVKAKNPAEPEFIQAVQEKAVGQEVLRSITPGQQVVKIVNEELIATL